MTLVVEAADFQLAVRRTRLPKTRGTCSIYMETEGETLTLSADNRDARVSAFVPVLEGQLPPAHIPYDTISSVLATYPAGPVSIEVVGHELRLRGQRARSKLYLFDAEAFPRRHPIAQGAETLDLSDIWWTIRRVASAADSGRLDWVQDLLFHGGFVYATDKYRVHRCAVPNLPDCTVRLPGAVINTVIETKTPVLSLTWDDTHFQLVASDAVWTGGLNDPEEVKKVAPAIARPYEPPLVTGFTADRKELIKATTSCMKLKIDQGNTFHEVVGLYPEDDGLVVRRWSADVGEHALTIAYDSSGNLNPVGFNAHNLVDTLQLLECEKVSIRGPENPRGAWRTDDGHLEVAIMPSVSVT